MQDNAVVGIQNHRCRLYKVSGPIVEDSTGVYTEVWDKLEDPEECDLPDGNPIYTVIAPSWDQVREKMDAYQEQNRVVSVGAWDSRGSI